VWEIGEWVTGRWRGPSAAVLLVSIAAVGLVFVSIQLWEPASEAFGWALGAGQWPFRAVAAIVSGAPPPTVAPAVATADVEDLVALPALAITWLLGRRRLSAA
jgi:hypothetical protein